MAPVKKRSSTSAADDSTSAAQQPTKRSRITKKSSISIGSSRNATVVKTEPGAEPDVLDEAEMEALKQRFLDLFTQKQRRGQEQGLTNAIIKREFGTKYQLLVPFINELLNQSRLTLETLNSGDKKELVYRLISEEAASKYHGLDQSHRLILQIIEKAGDRGIWTKDIRTQSSLQEQALKKIYKLLESRKLIKPIYAVAVARKKLYMLYDVVPAREVTGGPWYTEMEFDHEFIAELRMFILHCVKNMNGGKGVTMEEISEKMIQMKISRVQLNMEEVKQLLQTLVYDYLIEQETVNSQGMSVFVAARKVNCVSEFKGWNVLDRDFHFRRIRYDDGLVLKAHEPHHHSA
mmetsp:Transcript_20985/g.32014  ORF Transcript_20985/g.32014 Transcript_20985/m.32014 type:complete len:348 (-) Transcript_20985:322-1365(-)|eukprot:CAMPEP_0196816308 /NCGR_PEP_ID=MMETSP1362-20130617/54587_1 /TAXON_ID=163516 /ORGANISM="Leptocylindrus danicus, Strain CCMP1856" /LENGTH=347 /DNA_ID=CAMNT_0042193579 /DNA_START=61 /DNA_END=1104 /DNA_ORIENTATION=-